MAQPGCTSGSVCAQTASAAPMAEVVDEFGWTVLQRAAFLDALATASAPEDAATAAGHALADALRLRRQCAEFARGWAMAIECAVDLAEVRLLHFAVHGVPRQQVREGTLHKFVEFNTALMMFVLRAFRPGKYATSRAQAMPEVTPTMSRSEMMQRLKTISRRIATEDAAKPTTSGHGAQ